MAEKHSGADVERTAAEEADLVRRAQHGQVDAFEAIFRRYQARIYTFLHHMVRRREEAEDLTQTTFVRAWDTIQGLRSPGALGAWLHRIAANAARDYLKSARRKSELPLFEDALSEGTMGHEPAPDPARDALDAETRKAVRGAIAALPELHRSVVVMHHLEGMSVDDIAKALGVRAGTVMSRLSRAREALRDALAEHLDLDADSNGW
ncbi:MAG: sigma-70 family RNA polymerase sigma factor [Armatimonadota bacterium]|nr:MAG: sigma-70 family RNA polymerase sigma factor [Armatimonadota bacterium]